MSFLREQKCLKNGGWVYWCPCTRTRLTLIIVITIEVSGMKPHNGSFGEGDGNESFEGRIYYWELIQIHVWVINYVGHSSCKDTGGTI